MNYRRFSIIVILLLLISSGVEYWYIGMMKTTQERAKSAIIDLMHTNIQHGIEEINYIENAVRDGNDKNAVHWMTFLDSTLYDLRDHVEVYDVFLNEPFESNYQNNVQFGNEMRFGNEMHSMLIDMRSSIMHFPDIYDEPFIPLSANHMGILIDIRRDLQSMQQKLTKDLLQDADNVRIMETFDSIQWNFKDP